MTISESELESLTAYIVELEGEVNHLRGEVDMLRRHFILHTEGRESLERATRSQSEVLPPLPPGYGYGNAGQVIGLTYEAAQESAPWWFKPTPVKRSKTPD